MGLIITSEIQTSRGATSEAYLNINRYSMRKGRPADIWISTYLNKESRDESELNKVDSYQVYSRLGISELTDLETESIYQFAYSKLKEVLEEKGLTVIDDI
tara:strand:+ start:595 stop:897 length:303 start_codon:yes stop_codon:yes gene_type:complete